MKHRTGKQESKLSAKTRRYPLVFATIVAFSCVMSAAVSTFAWFQAEARVQIQTADPATATISVSAPEGAKFYYFTGNGTPGGDYTGYSRQNSAIGTAPRTYATSSSGVTWSNFVQIDLGSSSTALNAVSPNNCFNFSKMRPGCFYSFCATYPSSSTGVTLTFSDSSPSVNGDGLTPKRRLYYNGVTTTPLSLAMALNGYSAASTNDDSSAASFIETSLTKGADKANDAIVYNPDAANPLTFPVLTSINTTASATAYMYFTIYMGANDKSDALLYHSKDGTGSSEILYYQADQTTGDYSALDGLSLTLSEVKVNV